MLLPINLLTLPLKPSACDRLAHGETPLAYSAVSCDGCLNHHCALMPVQERLECLRCTLETEAAEAAAGLHPAFTVAFLPVDAAILAAQRARGRAPGEWRRMAEKYESLGLEECAILCRSKRQEERRRRRKKRRAQHEAQVEDDIWDDMFPDGIDAGFTSITSSD